MSLRAVALISLVLLLSVAMPLEIAEASQGMDSITVHRVRVTCEANETTTIITILLELPSPGYKLLAKNVTVENGDAIIDLWFSKPSQPVIQVITSWGTTVEVNNTITNVTIRVNGTTVYTGSCGETEQTVSGETSTEPVNNTTGREETSSPTRASGASPQTADNENKSREINLAMVGLGILLAGLAMAVLGLRR